MDNQNHLTYVCEVDILKIKRRIVDFLFKYAQDDDVIQIAAILKIKLD